MKIAANHLGGFTIVWALLFSPVGVAAELESRSRRPVSLAISEDANWLFTANRDGGSVSVVDLSTRQTVGEVDIGGRPSALASLDNNHLLVLDERDHQLIVLRGEGTRWDVAHRLTVAEYPRRLVVDEKHRRCFISSLWSRAVTVVELTGIERQGASAGPGVTGELRLPFEPGELSLARNGTRLVVASAFGGALAVIDTDFAEVIAVKKVSGHGIRGLAVDHDQERILLTMQELNPLARSTFDDVHWGNMLSNLLVSLSLDELCDARAEMISTRVTARLGEPGRGAGDPGPITIGGNGEVAILISGTSEVALGRDGIDGVFRRVGTGRRPNAAVASGGRLFVADSFADSISIVDVAAAKRIDVVSLGPQPELSLSERGEMLFFDSRLSHDGWMSCHGCHTDGHSSGQLNDNLSDGSFGAAKRVLSLLGVGETGPWGWLGNVDTLEEQVRNSIEKTMRGPSPPDDQVAALVAFLRTLPPPPAAAKLTGEQASGRRERGRQLFRSLNCHDCHEPPSFTSRLVYDVELTDSVGNTEFNPPSLRGVGRRLSLLHDGRASSLRDLLTTYRHQLNRELSDPELNLLVDFLMELE